MTKCRRILPKVLSAALALSITASIFTVMSVADERDAPQTEISEQRDVRSTGFVRINGRNLFHGEIFTKNGVTFVPLFRFAAWLGNFNNKYDSRSKTATVTGENLKISAREGTLYIEANGRYFYTEEEILIRNGEMFVPIKPIVKALNSYVSYDSNINAYVVSSGDTRLLKSGDKIYNADDIYWLAKIISAEAEGEPMRGKIAVGNVILNRVRSKSFPNTIYGVIFDKKHGVQFAPTSNGRIYKAADAESIIAAKMCYEGYSLSSEILYFLNPSASSSNWIANNRPYAFTIKNHYFYK